MSGRKTSDHFAWLFYKKNGDDIVCQFPVEVAGKMSICGHSLKRHIANGADHLMRKHGVHEGSKEVEAKRVKQTGLQQKVLGFTKSSFSRSELEALAAAESYQPFNFTEGKFFRLAFSPSVLSEEGIRSSTLRLATRLREEAVASLRGQAVTLCFDSGTVWSRYLVIVAKCGSKEMVLGAVCDDAWCKGWWWKPGLGVQTSANVQHILRMTKDDLKTRGVTVAAICADNASNFQSDDCKVEGTVQLRCVCHVLQLCAKDLLEGRCADAVVAANALLALFPKDLPAPVVTRWNSMYRLMAKISVKRGDLSKAANLPEDYDSMTAVRNVEKVEEALPILKPFAISTDIGQSSTATLWNQLCIFDIIPAATLPANRRKQLITDGIALLAFFMPNVKRQLLVRPLCDKLRGIAASIRILAENVHGELLHARSDCNFSRRRDVDEQCRKGILAVSAFATPGIDWFNLASGLQGVVACSRSSVSSTCRDCNNACRHLPVGSMCRARLFEDEASRREAAHESKVGSDGSPTGHQFRTRL